jgi:hypothetical protein
VEKPGHFSAAINKQTTRCSSSYIEVANELDALEKGEWQDLHEIQRPVQVQGMALRSFQYIDGQWFAVDIEDGVITVVAQLPDGDVCCCMSSSEPEEVVIVDGPETARDFLDQVSSSHGLDG